MPRWRPPSRRSIGRRGRVARVTAEDAARNPLELPAGEMRRLATLVADAVVGRWAGLRERPVVRTASREELEARLREPLPYHGEPLEELLDRFWEEVEPFAGRIDHPRFLAFIPSSPTFASLLGDWLAAGCNFFQGTWLESAGPSQVELVVLDWLKSCLGYPPEADGLLTSGGSAANLMGLAVAREELLGGDPAGGTVYGSDQTHTAVDRALRILGVPAERFRRLPSGPDWRLEPAAVARAVAEDRAAGLRPFCVVANAGTTNTGAVDPLPELAYLCRRERLWLHVDGAYGALGRITVRGRKRLEGLERADSLVLDPHKWLYVGYEAGCLLVRDAGALRRCFHVRPDYLQDLETSGVGRSADGEGVGGAGVLGGAGVPGGAASGEVNFADLGIQLTRQARALKLWLSLKTHGLSAMIAAVDRTQHLAEVAERRIDEMPVLELASHAVLGILSFRYVGDPPIPEAERDALNVAILRRMTEEGRFMLSSTRLGWEEGAFRGGAAETRYVIRLCPMNHRTTPEDVEAALREVARVGRELVRGGDRSGGSSDARGGR